MTNDHPVRAYRKKHDLSSREAGRLFGCAGSTIDRLEQEGRAPSPELMQRMIDVSDGELLPNDFYKLPKPSNQTAA
ncbi:helix-turn-helix domain-containing protein [uncultured Cohaesibacter sp.]|uniref:helix-turn-helix domain-containing protein n=1 Tax=uncultured Cohaesibacter sp. TaxID=1002546 RepID=UPI0037482E2B